jgi:hypothetical protein
VVTATLDLLLLLVVAVVVNKTNLDNLVDLVAETALMVTVRTNPLVRVFLDRATKVVVVHRHKTAPLVAVAVSHKMVRMVTTDLIHVPLMVAMVNRIALQEPL